MKTKSRPAPPETHQSLTLTANAQFDLEAAGEGAASLPRFRMVAYTGGPMRVAGWRFPVILDLAGLAIPSQARPIRFGHDPLAGVKPYKSIGVGLPTTGAVDVYASFDGMTYFAFEWGLVVEEQFMKCWEVSIPAQWLKFVGRSTVDTEGLPDGTILAWGGKS